MTDDDGSGSDDKQQSMTPRGFPASLLAEFIGTAIVTLGTVGPAVIARGLGFHLGYAVETGTTGLATMVIIYSFRNVSGAHTNPCTTLAFALRKDFHWARVPGYIAVQFLGAIAAGALMLAIFQAPRTALLPEMSLGIWPAFWLEIVLTTVLIIVALSTANAARFIGPEAAIANGATTVVDRWIGGHISSGSMNPARTLGPAIVAGGFGAWWVYVVAPLIGMLVAVALVSAMWRAPDGAGAQQQGGGAS
ncbi:MAG: aquaporin [Candidatus Eremiobacteraeota bacterium]|nr:aquaporin [Candidatus Eremiobacteraeota bacterium]